MVSTNVGPTRHYDSQGLISNPETITLIKPDGITGKTIQGAVPFPVYPKETARSDRIHPAGLRELDRSYGAYQGRDVGWTIAYSELGTFIAPEDICPRFGIRSAKGVHFTVLEHSHSDLGQFVKLVTRNLAIAIGMEDIVDVQHPTQVENDVGADLKDWDTVSEGEVCRIQPVQQESYEDNEVSSTFIDYMVYFARPIQPKNAQGEWCRLKWHYNKANFSLFRYLVVSQYGQYEHIDVLPEAHARFLP